jgi:hypothetical protein
MAPPRSAPPAPTRRLPAPARRPPAPALRPPALALLAGALLAALALAGCGAGGRRVPDVSGLPLPAGARIVTRARKCDPGANAYCAQELVVEDRRFASSQALLAAERRLLHRRGWTGSFADNGLESSDYSPGGGLHATFSSANEDLLAIDLGWIHRQDSIKQSLARTMFAHPPIPALSVYLEIGPG